MVSRRPSSRAISVLVPTPSVALTRTGRGSRRQLERRAEPAETTEQVDARRTRGGDAVAQQRHGPIAGGDIDARRGVRGTRIRTCADSSCIHPVSSAQVVGSGSCSSTNLWDATSYGTGTG